MDIPRIPQTNLPCKTTWRRLAIHLQRSKTKNTKTMYAEIQEEVDRIAEHMRFLGIKPISSLSRVVEVSGVGEAKTNISEMEMIKDLLEGHKKIIDMLGEVAEEAEAQKSRGTVNLVDDLNEAHGKFVWMLRSFTE